MIYLLLLNTLALAESPLTVDRPTNGTASTVVGKGDLQIETGLQIDGNLSAAVYSLPTMLRIGLHERFELRPYATALGYDTDISAFTGAGLQAKAHLFSKEDLPLSVGLVVGSDADLENGAASGALLLDFAKGNYFAWINTGVAKDYSSDVLSSVALWGVGYALPNNQGLFFENTNTIKPDFAATIEGGYYRTWANFQADLYLLKDISNDGQWQLATGFAWRFH